MSNQGAVQNHFYREELSEVEAALKTVTNNRRTRS
jgi:hypothetical protein